MAFPIPCDLRRVDRINALDHETPSMHTDRDEELKVQITRAQEANYRVQVRFDSRFLDKSALSFSGKSMVVYVFRHADNREKEF